MTTELLNMACTRCNSTQFIKPHNGELQDNDIWTCAGCGGQITVGEARKQSIDAAKQLITNTVAGLFKKR